METLPFVLHGNWFCFTYKMWTHSSYWFDSRWWKRVFTICNFHVV